MGCLKQVSYLAICHSGHRYESVASQGTQPPTRAAEAEVLQDQTAYITAVHVDEPGSCNRFLRCHAVPLALCSSKSKSYPLFVGTLTFAPNFKSKAWNNGKHVLRVSLAQSAT